MWRTELMRSHEVVKTHADSIWRTELMRTREVVNTHADSIWRTELIRTLEDVITHAVIVLQNRIHEHPNSSYHQARMRPRNLTVQHLGNQSLDRRSRTPTVN